MILNASFFYGDLYIAQITEPSVQALLADYINKYEPEFLQNAMGYGLYKLYNGSANVIYTDITNGKEYTNRAGNPAKWQGLKYKIGTKDASPIANYVWYKYIQDNQTQTTATGEKTVSDNGSNVDMSPWRKMVKVWNDMVVVNEQMVHFLEANSDVYPEFSRYNIKRELFMFKNPLF